VVVPRSQVAPPSAPSPPSLGRPASTPADSAPAPVVDSRN
jgi:hypothetical protein